MAKKEEKANKENKKSFFKGFKAELKKVSWPTPKQLVNNTIAVITIVLITAAIVFILDFAFEGLNKYGVDKIKESIGTLSNEENSMENNIEENSAEDSTTEDNFDDSLESEGTENNKPENVE